MPPDRKGCTAAIMRTCAAGSRGHSPAAVASTARSCSSMFSTPPIRPVLSMACTALVMALSSRPSLASASRTLPLTRRAMPPPAKVL